MRNFLNLEKQVDNQTQEAFLETKIGFDREEIFVTHHTQYVKCTKHK